MRFIVQLIFISLLALVLALFLPWWSIALAAAAGGFLVKSNANFLSGFLGIAVLWTIRAMVIDMNAAVPLAGQIATLLMVNSKAILFLVTAILGGLVGGFAALTGAQLRKEKKRSRYY